MQPSLVVTSWYWTGQLKYLQQSPTPTLRILMQKIRQLHDKIDFHKIKSIFLCKAYVKSYYHFCSYQMKVTMLALLVLCMLVGVLEAKSHPEAKLEFVDYCKYFNYPVQYHDVTTSDGYILRVFRIQKKGTVIKSGLKPIFLQHGLLDSSDTWILNDQNKAIGFILANLGYDVWMGNNRGNKHSRRHVKYNPNKDKQFWDFTFQHMAQYDLPEVMAFVAGLTGQKMHYIGHSQGTIQMHIALAVRNPVVENNLDKYFGLGPVAYITHQSAPLIDLLDKSYVLQWFQLRKIYEFMPSMTWFESTMGMLFCATFPHVCTNALKYIMDADPGLDNYERADVIVGHQPSGTSVTNMAHWKQLLDNKSFQAFDYGSSQKNIQHYGQPEPPKWNLGNIRVPIRLFSGDSDELADPTDVAHLWEQLDPSVKQFHRQYTSGHVTFIWGTDITPWMDDILSMLAISQTQTVFRFLPKGNRKFLKAE